MWFVHQENLVIFPFSYIRSFNGMWVEAWGSLGWSPRFVRLCKVYVWVAGICCSCLLDCKLWQHWDLYLKVLITPIAQRVGQVEGTIFALRHVCVFIFELLKIRNQEGLWMIIWITNKDVLQWVWLSHWRRQYSRWFVEDYLANIFHLSYYIFYGCALLLYNTSSNSFCPIKSRHFAQFEIATNRKKSYQSWLDDAPSSCEGLECQDITSLPPLLVCGKRHIELLPWWQLDRLRGSQSWNFLIAILKRARLDCRLIS